MLVHRSDTISILSSALESSRSFTYELPEFFFENFDFFIFLSFFVVKLKKVIKIELLQAWKLARKMRLVVRIPAPGPISLYDLWVRRFEGLK